MILRDRVLMSFFALLFVVGCAESEAPQAKFPSDELSGAPKKFVSAVEPLAEPRLAIDRHLVKSAIAKGLGYFLQFVDLDPKFNTRGAFYGWKVVRLNGPTGTWDGIDIKSGDVILRINGFALRRDVEADKAFRSLAVASEIRVTLERDGKPYEFRMAIVDSTSVPHGNDMH